MTVSLHTGQQSFEVGASSFFNSFFSTVYARLENDDWGSRFPALMNGLFPGRLHADAVPAALAELRTIRQEFKHLQPDAMVWDYEDRTKEPPWGKERAGHITTLADYFITSDGKDLFEVIEAALETAASRNSDVEIA
jgi:2,3-bisphosphoglycerate-dependent phosphoglycerate mutase